LPKSPKSRFISGKDFDFSDHCHQCKSAVSFA
jgi:hypothetical protein